MSAPTSVKRLAARGAVAVTGSKGGVGKSNLAVNLAVALGRWGRRVLVVDGDLGLANLDVLLGLVPTRNIEHLIRAEATLEQLLVDGPEGVRVLPAASGVPDLARLAPGERAVLLSALSRASEMADHVLVDTGAGLGEATLSLQLAASRVLVVTTSEPTSLVDAYATLKVLWSVDPEKRIDIVVNSVESEDEASRAFRQVERASKHFLNRSPGMAGLVYRDPMIPEAVRQQRALMELSPHSRAGRCIEQLALSLMADAGDVSPAEYWTDLMDRCGMEMPN